MIDKIILSLSNTIHMDQAIKKIYHVFVFHI